MKAAHQQQKTARAKTRAVSAPKGGVQPVNCFLESHLQTGCKDVVRLRYHASGAAN